MRRTLFMSTVIVLAAIATSSAKELSTEVSGSAMRMQPAVGQKVKRAAGLGMQLNSGTLPELTALQGEVFLEGSLYWLRRNRRIPRLRGGFGRISIPGCNRVVLKEEKTTWVSNEVVYDCGQSSAGEARSLRICVSRLSPAVVVRTDADGLTLFARTNAPDLPGFYAVGSAEGVKTGRLEESIDIAGPARWLLLWNGRNTNILGGKDNAFLIVPHIGLRGIRMSRPGGINLVFEKPGAKASLLLLDGIVMKSAADTKKWVSDGLPDSVREKCDWWTAHLGRFPIDVTETFEYDGESDRVSVKYSFQYIEAEEAGGTAAPLPPMLALAAKEGLGKEGNPLKLEFSGSVVYTGSPTIFGPYAVVDGVREYTWTLVGLKRYTEQVRKVGPTVAAAETFEKKLAAEVEKVVKTGALASWVFQDEYFGNDSSRRTLYWGDAGENLYFLVEMMPLLGGDAQEAFGKYLVEYQRKFAPESYGRILPTVGARREFYHVERRFLEVPLPEEDSLEKGPILNSLYGLSRFCQATGTKLDGERWEKCRGVFSEYLKGRDWATLFWFRGGGGHGPGVAGCNRNFAGLVGLTRLAGAAGDKEAERLGYGQLACTAALRYAMGRYRQYLYGLGRIRMPEDPKWQAVEHSGDWTAQLLSYNCTKPEDDIEQIYWLDSFQARTGTFDPTGWTRITRPYQMPFMYMAPELGRFLGDFLKAESARHVQVVAEYQPNWYMSWSEATLGTEHNMNQPCDAYNNFMARAWISGESGKKLRRYLDVPHLAVGDYFYMHKLAEIIRAYRGAAWQKAK